MGAWSISAPPFKTFQGLDHPGRRPGRQQGRCAQTGKNGIQNIIANNCGRGQSVNTRPSGKGNPTHTHKTTRAARSHTNSHTSGHFGDWSRSTWWEFRIEQKNYFYNGILCSKTSTSLDEGTAAFHAPAQCDNCSKAQKPLVCARCKTFTYCWTVRCTQHTENGAALQ
jgi:hypothetical protein